MSKFALDEIRKWKLDAKVENNARYFYLFEQARDVESGDACFVIGRKGSGKTAIAAHINSIKSYLAYPVDADTH